MTFENPLPDEESKEVREPSANILVRYICIVLCHFVQALWGGASDNIKPINIKLSEAETKNIEYKMRFNPWYFPLAIKLQSITKELLQWQIQTNLCTDEGLFTYYVRQIWWSAIVSNCLPPSTLLLIYFSVACMLNIWSSQKPKYE